jgi:hypothetical protein
MTDQADRTKHYAIEKLYDATLSLIGEGDIHERLESAALTLVSRMLRANDFPTDLGKEYDAIHEALTSRVAEVEGEGSIHATIRNLTPHEAAKISERIFSLYVNLLHGSALE